MFTRECLRGEWNSRDAIGTLRRIESEFKLVLKALLKVELVVSSCAKLLGRCKHELQVEGGRKGLHGNARKDARAKQGQMKPSKDLINVLYDLVRRVYPPLSSPVAI